MDWGQSYSATWRVFRVNRDTWADAESIANIDSVSITRTADGDLLESGSIELTGELTTDYYRVVMTAEQGSDIQREDVATLLFDVVDGEYDYGTHKQEADGYSVLYPASVTSILAGEYAPKGVNGAEYAAELLRGAINAPVEVEGGFILNENIVHEIGLYVIDAVWAVLNAGNFIIQIDGRGVVHIRPEPTEPSLILDSRSLKLIENGIKYSTDISSVPNRYIVLVDNNKTIAENADPESSISTVSRGYFVDEVDESPTPINGETLSAYADRRLRKLSVMTDKRAYKREYAPNVFLYSIIRASINGLEGDLRVQSQKINCGHGITVSEKATREISLWQ